MDEPGHTQRKAWQFDPDVPLHKQIYAVLEAEIRDGLYVGRSDFPGEVDLAERFHVSLVTARAVLQRLAREGLIDRGRGRRPQAVFQPLEPDPTERLMWDFDQFTYEIIRIEEAVGPAAACRTFGLELGAALWQCLRLRSVDGRPHSVTWSAQPLEIGRRHPVVDIPATPMPQLLARAGLPIDRVSRDISVSLPPPEVSAHLGIFVHHAVLLVTIVEFTAANRAADWSRIYYHPDRHQPLEVMHRESGSEFSDRDQAVVSRRSAASRKAGPPLG